MPPEATVPEVKPAEPIPTNWPAFVGKALHLYGAAGVLVAGLAWFSWTMIERSDRRTDQAMIEQKQFANENLKVVVQSVDAINTNTRTMEKVGDSVEANTKATEELARDVRELREESRREK